MRYNYSPAEQCNEAETKIIGEIFVCFAKIKPSLFVSTSTQSRITLLIHFKTVVLPFSLTETTWKSSKTPIKTVNQVPPGQLFGEKLVVS
jgi:hypothetical protein